MSGRVVVVTGGGRGIGRSICQRFASVGDHVVAASRSVDELEGTKRLIEADGGQCFVQQVDVADSQQLHGLMENTANRLGRIDVLVNNAGVALLSSFDELEPDQFERMLDVNVRALYHGCRAAWSVMSRQGRGVIVSISSVASVDPFPGFAAYGASKAWVNAWTRGLAQEGKPLGISVFAVAPGAVETQMLRGAFPDFPGIQALEPGDVADTVYALSLPECRHASGQTVFVRK